ncbi:SpoIVB peptidase [Hathewaya histolytica]|uniref:SpoIVB peptidase n=1 Tax=Hathewaya histolytica TaxID=1498 RepID=UPI003B66B0B5
MKNYSKKNIKFNYFILCITILFNICITYVCDTQIPQNYIIKANAKTLSNRKVYLGGEPLGIQINTKGALVVGLSDIDTEKGVKTSPAVKAGISIGDTILKVNDISINNGEDLSYIINNNKSQRVVIEIEHKGKKLTKNLVPVKSKLDDKYKIGLWVRDSTSGIGTLTFYDSKTGKYGALGHGITDVDTGSIIEISSGEVVPSEIVSVKKGLQGDPGELKGIFTGENKIIGNVKSNTICGIFGDYKKDVNNKLSKPIEIGNRKEIKEGKAQIYTTIAGKNPEFYDIEIEKLLTQEQQSSKSMVIKITDKRLLDKTGGIVQGMSGSPIVQNNKIVGAVTHVLVNKPDKGYGIYIEWMLEECEKSENN